MMKTMTIADVLEMVKNKKAREVSVSEIAGAVGLPGFLFNHVDDAVVWDDPSTWVFSEKPFDEWICWDTWVGKSVIYMKDQPVAVTVQPFRKADTEYYWIGKPAYQEVFDKCVALIRSDDTNIDVIGLDTIIDIEGEYKE